MDILLYIFILAFVVLGVVSLVRNNWDIRKAWDAIVAFVAAIVGAFMALWGGGGAPT